MLNDIGAKAQIINPALALFEPIIGEWQTTGTHPFFPDVELHGRASFEWIEGGAFVLLRSEIDHPEFPDGIQIFGSDDAAKTYFLLHFDQRGTSRKYDVSISRDELTWHRDDQEFAQRFTMRVGNDKLVIQGQMSRNGGEWERDLSQTCMRI